METLSRSNGGVQTKAGKPVAREVNHCSDYTCTCDAMPQYSLQGVHKVYWRHGDF